MYIKCECFQVDPAHAASAGYVVQIDVLEDIVKAVAGRCEVYLDGGVRTGTDVLKAIALGARAVFIGRPAIYALSYNVSYSLSSFAIYLKPHTPNTA